MTDEELVKALRDFAQDAYDDLAADRIEALTAERDDHWKSFVHWRKEADALTEQLEAARADAKGAEAYAEELEKERDDYAFKLADANNTYSEMHVALSGANDKLAKAVASLKTLEDASKFFGSDRQTDYETLKYAHETTRRLCRATLAEIEGEQT